MLLTELVGFFDSYLRIGDFPGDVSNNGLQVEGKDEVHRAVFGVDACQTLFDRAAEWDADFIFVHHGLSWGAYPKRFTGIEALRFGSLFRSRTTLYAVHLPLDAHEKSGNNAVLADMLDLRDRKKFFQYDGCYIGFCGTMPESVEAVELADLFQKKFPFAKINLLGSGKVKKVAVVSGGGGLESLEAAHAAGADLLLTGELTHVMYHPAIEYGIPVLALGHYASETTGPQAMCRLTAEKFGIECKFIDIPTGL